MMHGIASREPKKITTKKRGIITFFRCKKQRSRNIRKMKEMKRKPVLKNPKKQRKGDMN